MADSLLDIFSTYLTPEVVEHTSAFLDESPGHTEKAVQAAVPALLAALGIRASTVQGAESVMNLIQQVGAKLDVPALLAAGETPFNDLATLGRVLLAAMFGGDADDIAESLASVSGVRPASASTLLSVQMPIVLGVLGREVSSKSLSAAAVASLLASEREELSHFIPAPLNALLSKVSATPPLPLASQAPPPQPASARPPAPQPLPSPPPAPAPAPTPTQQQPTPAQQQPRPTQQVKPAQQPSKKKQKQQQKSTPPQVQAQPQPQSQAPQSPRQAPPVPPPQSAATTQSSLQQKASQPQKESPKQKPQPAQQMRPAARSQDAPVPIAPPPQLAPVLQGRRRMSWLVPALIIALLALLAWYFLRPHGLEERRAAAFDPPSAAPATPPSTGSAPALAGSPGAAAPSGASAAVPGTAAGTVPSAVARHNLHLESGTASETLEKFLATAPAGEVPKAFTFDRIVFQSASTTLMHRSRRTVADLIEILKAYPTVEARLEAHTDNMGDPRQNKALSVKRADAIKKLLVAGGIAESRLSTEGFGEEKPIASNDTVEGRRQNRRLDVVVVKR